MTSDLKKFTDYWNGERPEMEAVYELPEAVKAWFVPGGYVR